MQKLKKCVFQIINADNDESLSSKIFDVFIIFLIVLNVIIVILDTISDIPQNIKQIFNYIDTASVIIFTIEYLLRIWTADFLFSESKPLKAKLKYIFSFMAIVDLLAILPFYLPFVFVIDLKVLRLIRLLRLLRILKANRYSKALLIISNVLKKKLTQIISAISVIVLLMIISSVLMYGVENEAQPTVFENALSGLWWSVATFTTVGYGDIYPVTVVGKILGSIVSILGIGLVAIPTGIISAGFVEYSENEKQAVEKIYCPYCGEKIN